MSKTLTEQLREAQEAYSAALRRHPRSARTTQLWYRLRDLKTRVIKQEAKAA